MEPLGKPSTLLSEPRLGLNGAFASALEYHQPKLEFRAQWRVLGFIGRS